MSHHSAMLLIRHNISCAINLPFKFQSCTVLTVCSHQNDNGQSEQQTIHFWGSFLCRSWTPGASPNRCSHAKFMHAKFIMVTTIIVYTTPVFLPTNHEIKCYWCHYVTYEDLITSLNMSTKRHTPVYLDQMFHRSNPQTVRMVVIHGLPVHVL